MVSRITCVVTVVATSVVAPVLHADERPVVALDETTFIRRVLERGPRRGVLEARRRAAAAAVGAAAVLPNPTLSYEREAVPGIAAADDFLRLAIPLDLSGRRSRTRDAARAGAAAEGAAITADTVQLELDARAAYLDAIYARAVVDQLDRSRASLAALVDTLGKRARQGDASDYDASRAALELDTLDDERVDARRKHELARLRLGGLLGEPTTPYEPGEPLALPAAPGAAMVAHRADIDAVRARATHADREASAARRTFPRLELTGGIMRSTSSSGDGIGYVIGLGGELPIFDRGTAAAARGHAEARRWRAEADALAAEATSDIVRARHELIARIEQAAAYAGGPVKRAADLERRAQVTYREGDRPILELLDVQRASRHAAVRSLELIYEARRAELALRRAAGGKS